MKYVYSIKFFLPYWRYRFHEMILVRTRFDIHIQNAAGQVYHCRRCHDFRSIREMSGSIRRCTQAVKPKARERFPDQ